jgi:transcriptional regulator with XRE-family HTH domain
MTDTYKIGERIALLRRGKGLTGERLAELLGVSPQAVSKWETGRNLPETALLPKLAEILGATIDAILTPRSDETPEQASLVRESYVYIPVSDTARAADWYENALGLRRTTVDATFIELRGVFGVRIILIPVEPPGVHPQMQYQGMVQAAYGFTVSDYGAMQEHLRKSGAELTETIDYGGLACKFYDPDGNAIEIWSDYPNIL